VAPVVARVVAAIHWDTEGRIGSRLRPRVRRLLQGVVEAEALETASREDLTGLGLERDACTGEVEQCVDLASGAVPPEVET